MQKQARRASSMEGTSRMGKVKVFMKKNVSRTEGRETGGENSYVGMTMNNLE